MTKHLSSDDLDRHLRHIAHSLVDDAPAPPPLASIDPRVGFGLRQRRSRRRYLVAVVVAASVTLISIAAGLVGTTDRPGPTGVGQAPGAQRMILESWPAELRPDGSVVPLELGDLSLLALTGAPQPLPDARHVAVGERWPSVDVAPNRTHHLVVVDATGKVEVERQVGTATEWVGLLAATPREAILIKARRDESRPRSVYGSTPIGPGRIVAHDLATGAERALSGTAQLGLLHEVRADVSGDRIVLVRSSLNPGTNCQLLLIDLTGPDWFFVTSLANCSEVRAVRVSPDGQLAAVTYGNLNVNLELRVAVVDLDNVEVLEDVRLGEYGTCADPPCTGVKRPLNSLGLAWANDTAVRVALLDLKAYPDAGHYGSPIPRDAVLVDTVPVE
ncbi:MAG: hypothetical protein L0Y54_02510 [Sporichthyaceae bacterium]|nr:hypothetical protein [Sporichthyaceae bacterium]